jgi:hypothetical protein
MGLFRSGGYTIAELTEISGDGHATGLWHRQWRTASERGDLVGNHG